MKKRMIQSLAWLFCFMMAGSSSILAADTLKIVQISRHWVDSANKSIKKMVIEQQFFTKNDTLFRKIYYNETTGQITGYERCFYKNDRLFTKETFSSKDSLRYIMKHEYSTAGDLTVLIKLVPEQGKLVEKEKTLRTFNTEHQLLSEKKTFERKTGILTTYSYNTTGQLFSESRKYKKAANSPIKMESKAYTYQQNNQPSQIIYSAERKSGGLLQYAEDYFYNDQGKLASIRYSGKDNPPVAEKVYKYYNNGKLRVIEDHDAAGKITYLLHYEYKENFMDRGIEVSYYENF
jgi:hypothetical protein